VRDAKPWRKPDDFLCFSCILCLTVPESLFIIPKKPNQSQKFPECAETAASGVFSGGAKRMALFLSSYAKKIDKKGRVLVPNAFRAALVGEPFVGVVAYRSFINPCIEACGMSRIETLSRRIEALDPFSEEHDAFSATILGGSQELSFDGEGRMMLPPAMLEEAGIAEDLVFFGKGKTFEIWEPERFAAHCKAARNLALEKRHLLRAGGAEGV
jgi:MraZ protein